MYRTPETPKEERPLTDEEVRQAYRAQLDRVAAHGVLAKENCACGAVAGSVHIPQCPIRPSESLVAYAMHMQLVENGRERARLLREQNALLEGIMITLQRIAFKHG